MPAWAGCQRYGAEIRSGVRGRGIFFHDRKRATTSWKKHAQAGFDPAFKLTVPVFDFRNIRGFTFRAQTRASPLGYDDTVLPVKDFTGSAG